jgi:hypothetical protein
MRLRYLDVAAALTITALAGATACSPREGSGPPDATAAAATLPDRPASISGVVTAIDGGRVRIEEDPDARYGSGKAVVRTEHTRILHRSGSTATLSDLAVGQRVSAWFTGPVAESYPVQAAAAVLVIEADPR